MPHPPFVRPPIAQSLDLEQTPVGVMHRLRVVMTENATGNETLLPVIVLKSGVPGPVVGVTAAIHGNELNGIVVVQQLMAKLQRTNLLKGVVVAVPIVNVPGYLREQRSFEDGVDLNRVMPGRADGNQSALYAHRFMDRVVKHFDYLVDLHTASNGRVNSLYVRADMGDAKTAQLARLLSPQIILHSPGGDGTLRAAAQHCGACALTVEVGDPQRFQHGLVRSARLGVQEMLEHLGMVPDISDPDPGQVIECSRSYWIHTDRGGVLRVLPEVVSMVDEGEVVARLYNVWGDVVREYCAPERGVVIGRSVNPTASAGSRVLHLGIVGAVAPRSDGLAGATAAG